VGGGVWGTARDKEQLEQPVAVCKCVWGRGWMKVEAYDWVMGGEEGEEEREKGRMDQE
jgi:hypothetical protein